MPNYKHHSRGIMLHKYFAPARHHSEVSALTRVTSTPTGIAVLWNTRAFRSFQISQEIRSIRERSALRDSDLPEAMLRHHSLTETMPPQSVGWTSCKPSHVLIIPQTLTV